MLLTEEIRSRLQAIEQGQREESKLIFNAIMGFNERVKVIEQGQDILCERLDALSEQGKEQTDKLMLLVGIMTKATTDRLDRQIDVLGGMAANQAKPKRRKR